jgi:hypothetical protein
MRPEAGHVSPALGYTRVHTDSHRSTVPILPWCVCPHTGLCRFCTLSRTSENLQKWPPLLERPLSCALAIALTLSGYAGDAHRELCAVRAVLLLIPWRPSFTVLSMTCFRACAPAARASSGFGRGAHFVMASFPSTPVHAVSPCPSRIFPEALRTLLLISCAPPVASVQKRGTSRCVHHGKKSWSGRA